MRTLAFFGAAVFSLSMPAAQAQESDLTLPPELRANAPSPAPAVSDHPAKQPKPGKPVKKAAKEAEPPHAPAPVPTSVIKPHNTVEENPLSVGGSWNANNTAEGATRATSGLSEPNKNHDGESAGIGAKLGFGYKF